MAVDLRPPPSRQTRRVSSAPSSGAKTSASKTPAQEMDARAAERQAGLDQYVQTGMAMLMLARQHADAQALAMHGPNVTRELARLAGRYEKLGNTIDKMIAAGPFAGLVMAVMPLAMQLAVNHGFIKSPAMLATMGVQPKEVLEAEGRAAEQRMVIEAMKAQKRFEEEKAAFQQELADLASSNGAVPNGVSV